MTSIRSIGLRHSWRCPRCIRKISLMKRPITLRSYHEHFSNSRDESLTSSTYSHWLDLQPWGAYMESLWPKNMFGGHQCVAHNTAVHSWNEVSTCNAWAWVGSIPLGNLCKCSCRKHSRCCRGKQTWFNDGQFDVYDSRMKCYPLKQMWDTNR